MRNNLIYSYIKQKFRQMFDRFSKSIDSKQYIHTPLICVKIITSKNYFYYYRFSFVSLIFLLIKLVIFSFINEKGKSMAKTRGQRQGDLSGKTGRSADSIVEHKKVEEDVKETVHQIINMYEMPTAEDVSMLSSLVSEFKYTIKSALNSRNSEAKMVSDELQEDEQESQKAIKEVQENRGRIEQLNRLNNQYDKSVVNRMISENRDSEAFQDDLKREAIATREELSSTVSSVSNRVHSLLS